MRLLFLLIFVGLVQLVRCQGKTNDLGHISIEIEPDYLSEEVNLEVIIDPIVVCREDKADQCDCGERWSNQIVCTKETRDRNNKNGYLKPFNSAAITVNLTKLQEEYNLYTPEYVYLSGNQIKFINQATLLPNIQKYVKKLDLSDNTLEYIEEEAFDKCTSLEILHLDQNFLTLDETTDGWITEKLGQSLTVLYLSYNNITKLNDGVFSPLHSLRKLVLDGNSGLVLTDKTFEKGALTKLENLSLNKCNLKDLPFKVFENLPNLKVLSLIGNKFTNIPAALKLVPSLKSLDLSENIEMLSWPKKALKSNFLLERLYLNRMSFENYGDCAFCELKNLLTLDLSKSKFLSRIDKNAFGYMSLHSSIDLTEKLEILNLEDCNLTSLSDRTFPYYHLARIDLKLGGNPWDCEKMKKLTVFKQLRLKSPKEPTCEFPKIVRGVPLFKIQKQGPYDPIDSLGSDDLYGGKMSTKEKYNFATASPKTHYVVIRNHDLWHILFYGGISVVIISLILTTILIATKKRGVMRNKLMASRGFANLNFEPMDDKVQVVMDDVEEEEEDDRVYRP